MNETIRTIQERKKNLEENETLKQKLVLNQKEEEERFQKKVFESLQTEKKRLTEKGIQIHKREDLIKLFIVVNPLNAIKTNITKMILDFLDLKNSPLPCFLLNEIIP